MACPAFPITDRTRAQRLADRAVYDRPTVHSILDAAFICYVSFTRTETNEAGESEHFPSCIPTGFVRDGESILIHGKNNSLLQQRLAAGDPVCVTIALIDGLVMARSAFNHSVNYRSVMIFGSAFPITGHQEKLDALQKITDGLTYPGRSDELREVTTAEVTSTSVVRLELKEVSAKVRGHGVGDDADDLKQARDASLDEKDPNTAKARCWAGVIPLKLVSLPPEDDKDLIAGLSRQPAARARLLERPHEGIVPLATLTKPTGNLAAPPSNAQFWQFLSYALMVIVAILLVR